MQSDFLRMRNLSRQLKSGSSPWASILPRSCLLVCVLVGAAVQAEILSATKRAEMADVEQMKKIVH